MKKRIYSILFTITILLGSQNVYAMNETPCGTNSRLSEIQSDVYEYPISPTKTPEIWDTFTSHVEMIEACEIDERILAAMSTLDLIETCIHYPLLGDALCYDNINAGFEIVALNHNGLNTLLSREDISSSLKTYYENNIEIIISCMSDEEKIYLDIISCYLINNGYINQNDIQQIQTIVDETYSTVSSDTFFIAINEYLNRSYDGYATINSNVYYYNNVSVASPAGNNVAGYRFASDLVSSDVSYFETYRSNTYPNSTRVAGPTIFYNCHSYAWYSATTTNHVWINDPAIYMSEGSYTYTGTIGSGYSFPSTVVHGNKAFYQNSNSLYNHSAVIYNNSLFTSKWGAGCLVRHGQAYCPYYYSTTLIKIYERNYSS